MHATRDTTAFIVLQGAGGRVMRGVRRLIVNRGDEESELLFPE